MNIKRTLLRLTCLLGIVPLLLPAQGLPPPVAGGGVTLSVTVEGETREAGYQYLPPTGSAYPILAEVISRSLDFSNRPQAIVTSTEIPPAAGETLLTYKFAADYAAAHPEVVRPVVASADLSPREFESAHHYDIPYYQFSQATLKHVWDNEGRVTFELQAKSLYDGTISTIKGVGLGAALITLDGPAFWPTKFRARDVTETTGNIGRFLWGGPAGKDEWRYLEFIHRYYYQQQADGSAAVFHSGHFTSPLAGLREYPPIGELTVAGTPGHGREVRYHTEIRPLESAGTATTLRHQINGSAFRDDGYVLSTTATAHYHFTPEEASASKVRYKLQLEPGLARTISWAETFTPEGETLPRDYRFISEQVSATATETQPHIINPFERSGALPGVYQVMSFDAALAVDTNGDGKIISAANPVTPYLIAQADQVAAGGFAFTPNFNDHNADGIIDATDGQVNGPDDLPAFRPVYLDIQQLVLTLDPGNGFSYKLKQADSALNFVYTNLTPTTAFAYRDAPASGFGPGLDQPAASAPTQQITAEEGVDIFNGPTGSAAFLEAIRTRDGGILLIEARRATEQPLILEVTRNGQLIARIELPLQIFGPELAVDANRDGTIKLANEDASDATSATKPYRFWLNDDDDTDTTTVTGGGYTITTINESEQAPALHADYSLHQIVSKRNLEDFARLWINIQGILDSLKPRPDGTAALYLGLKWQAGYTGTPAVNVYLSADTSGTDSYLTDTTAAQTQLAGGFNNALIDINGKRSVDTAGAFIFPAGYWSTQTQADPALRLLFEGAGEGSGQLVSVLLDPNGNVIGTGPGIWMNLRSVQDYYEQALATNVTSGKPPSSLISDFSATTTTLFPGANESKQVIVFIHGINNTEDDFNSSSNTIFKRLYWSGYRGRFTAFRWPCAYLPPTTPNPFQYNLGEFYAFKSATALRSYLGYLRSRQDLEGYAINLYAHSQGNVVASEAVLQGAAFDNYILTQGAIPAHCYDTSAPFLQKLVDAETSYPSNATPFDSVYGGYNGYFSGIQGNVVNFFNANDFALASGVTFGFQTNWEENQRTQKPESFIGGPSYIYDRSTNTASAYILGFQSYYVTDMQEAKSMVARSRSRAVGAQGGLQGVISSSVDLVSGFGFGTTRDEHSAQFTRPIQTAIRYWDEVVRTFSPATP